MQLSEAKAMSEWLSLYIKLSEFSLNLDLDLGLEINITYQSHSYRMVLWQTSRSYYYYSQDRAGMPGMEESCYLDLENNNDNNNKNNNNNNDYNNNNNNNNNNK